MSATGLTGPYYTKTYSTIKGVHMNTLGYDGGYLFGVVVDPCDHMVLVLEETEEKDCINCGMMELMDGYIKE